MARGLPRDNAVKEKFSRWAFPVWATIVLGAYLWQLANNAAQLGFMLDRLAGILR